MALIGLTRKEITRLEKHKLKRRKFRVEALKVSSFLSVVTISKLETIPKKLRPISRSTKIVHSVVPVNPLVILRCIVTPLAAAYIIFLLKLHNIFLVT